MVKLLILTKLNFLDKWTLGHKSWWTVDEWGRTTLTPKTSKDAEKYEIKATNHIGAKFHDISRYIFETIERSKVKIEQDFVFQIHSI